MSSWQNIESFCSRISFGGGLPIHQHRNPKLCSPWTSSAVICKPFPMSEPRTSPWTPISLSLLARKTSLAADYPLPGLGTARHSPLEFLASRSRSAQCHCLLCLPSGLWPQYDQGGRRKIPWARPAMRLPQSHCRLREAASQSQAIMTAASPVQWVSKCGPQVSSISSI